ncbi:MAG: hypothetical protein WBO24_05900 [Nitrospirales bacterium]
MNSTVIVWADYVCPYWFFTEHLISQAADNKALTMEWMPYEIGPTSQPKFPPDGNTLNECGGIRSIPGRTVGYSHQTSEHFPSTPYWSGN